MPHAIASTVTTSSAALPQWAWSIAAATIIIVVSVVVLALALLDGRRAPDAETPDPGLALIGAAGVPALDPA